MPRMRSRGVARRDDCIGQLRSPAPGRCREADLRIWGAVGRSAAGSAFDDEAPASTSAVRGVAARNRARRRSPVTGSGCGSPRAALRPSSGQGVGDGCGDSRGVPAPPTSPSAGLRPIRRRPSRPSSDRPSMLGRLRGLAQSTEPNFLNVDRQPGQLHLRQPATRPRTKVRVAKGHP